MAPLTMLQAEIELFLGVELPQVTSITSEGKFASGALLIADTMVYYSTAPLKALLRSLHRLMQTGGGSEGLRNLADSELPKSLKRVFESSSRFGPRVYALGTHCVRSR